MLIKINGRTKFFSRVEELRRISNSRWLVRMPYGYFEVAGGRNGGGTSRDWFIEQVNTNTGRWRGFGDNIIPATSLVDALNLLDNA